MNLRRILTVRLIVLPVISVYIIYVRADLNKTFVAGQNAVLPCEGMASASDTYIWAEDISPSEIRIYVATRIVLKTDDARGIKKYENFFINSLYPESVDMVIQSINLDDRGSYKCELVIQSRTVSTYNVQIEVPPQSVAITCVDYSTCPTSSDDNALSGFNCTCEAIGAYPNTLTIQWNGGTGSLTNISSSLIGQNGTFDFSSHAVFRPHFIKTSISCAVTGFHNDLDSSVTSALYTVSPPSCTLLAATTENCSMATLTCSCNGAIPDVKSYTFYNKNRSLIGHSINTNVFENVHIRQGEYETFYCRGCNGLFFGENSLARVTFMCTEDITTSGITAMSDITTSGITTISDITTSGITTMSDITTSGITTMSDITTSGTTTMSEIFTPRTTLTPDLTTEATIDSDFSSKRATSPDRTSEKVTLSDEGTTFSDRTTERTTVSEHTTKGTTLLGYATTGFDGTPSLSPQEEKPCKTFTWLLVCSIEGLIVAVLVANMVVKKLKGIKTRKGDQRRLLVDEMDLPVMNEDILLRQIDSSEIRHERMNNLLLFSPGGYMKYHKADYNGRSIIKKLLSENAPQYLDEIFTEEIKSVVKLSNNENVVEVLGWCNTEPAILIHEFVEGRTLLQYAWEGTDGTHHFPNSNDASRVLNENHVKDMISMAVQVACGLGFLHRNKFIHPGLRAEKVLVNSFKTCKLFAFLSEHRVQELRCVLWEQRDPYQWMSPEYHQWGESTSTDDVWSFGVLFWELLSGSEPYEGLDKPEVLSRLRDKKFLERPRNCPEPIWQIITDCWNSPQRRARIDGVVELLQSWDSCDERSSTYDEIEP